jgi:hypothetical protein
MGIQAPGAHRRALDSGRGLARLALGYGIAIDIHPVIAGLVPAIHVFNRTRGNKTSMPGTRPGMTTQ